jgi:hypothetical protein
MEAKLKNLTLIVGMCKKVPDIAVLMGMHFNCSKVNLIQLKSNNPSDELLTGAESSALGYALFESIRDKFVGSPLELSRSRVSRVDCDSINGKLLISWNTQGSVSMLRKTIGLALSTMDPSKLYSKYAENIKLLGGKNDRDVFNYLATEMIDAIKKGIKIDVVGKIKVDAAKLKDILAKVDKKLPNKTSVPKGSKPEKHAECPSVYPHVKASGITAVVVADYIKSKSGGMGVDVFDGKIVVYNKSWDVKKKSLMGPRVADYVRQKYIKLNDDFAFVLAYLAITQSLADCCTIAQIIKTKPTATSMTTLIQKSL